MSRAKTQPDLFNIDPLQVKHALLRRKESLSSVAVMIDLEGKAARVPLKRCTAWMAPILPSRPGGDMIELPPADGKQRWAVGNWDGYHGYIVQPNGYHLTEVSEAAIVSICNHLGCSYPTTLTVPEIGSQATLAGDGSIRLTASRRKILEVLAKSKTRMVKPQILAALMKANPDESEHTLRAELTKMIAPNVGWIDNDPKASPRGYGITELGRLTLKTAQSVSL